MYELHDLLGAQPIQRLPILSQPSQVNRIWINSSVHGNFLATRNAFDDAIDLPAVIVHEMLHKLGFKDPYLMKIYPWVQNKCGNPDKKAG